MFHNQLRILNPGLKKVKQQLIQILCRNLEIIIIAKSQEDKINVAQTAKTTFLE